MIPIHEMLHTFLGEGRMSGLRCVIIRTHGCNLKCSWCDTPQDRVAPRPLPVEEIVAAVRPANAGAVLITGGEPLLHDETPLLAEKLLGLGLKVLVETNGSLDIAPLPAEAIKIMDLKPPSSGFAQSSLLSNVKLLTGEDEIKIVIAGREDYLWARDIVEKELGSFRGTINLSPAWAENLLSLVAQWILEDKMEARLNLQMHKIIFPDGEHALL
ncbi:MAG: radical SAM protein [Pseudomonadota bacterium]